MEGIVGVFRIIYNSAWPVVAAGAILLTLSVLPRVPGWAAGLPPPRAVLWILLPPLVLVVWSGANWGAEEYPRTGMQWRSYVLLALAIGAMVAAIATPILYRHSPRWWLLIPCSLTAILFTALATFVGGMAIVNDWI